MIEILHDFVYKDNSLRNEGSIVAVSKAMLSLYHQEEAASYPDLAYGSFLKSDFLDP